MAQIFISHVHEEAEIAQAVLRFLRAFKLDAFLSTDPLQINPGERWFDRIASELTEAKVVLLLLSRQSVNRPWINFEAGWAWGLDTALIPICFGGLEKGAMPRPYSDLQGLNLNSTADCYALLKGCGHAAGFLPPPDFVQDPKVIELTRVLEEFEKKAPQAPRL
jgi:TIR domain